jgi:hypothetical protein
MPWSDAETRSIACRQPSLSGAFAGVGLRRHGARGHAEARYSFRRRRLTESFKRFVDHINDTGKGMLQIRIVGGRKRCRPTAEARAVKSGVLDIASIPPTYYKSAMVEGDAQILPT